MTTTQAGVFMNLLAERPDVGGEIVKYMKRERVRTYIKDAIINNYSKDKTTEAMPNNPKPIIKSIFGVDAEESHKEVSLQLYKSVSMTRPNEYIVISEGTVLNWGSALKRALLFIAAKPFSKTASNVYILLFLFAQHKPLTLTDKETMEKALDKCDARPFIFGEK